MSFQVAQPILNSAFEEPNQHWYVTPGAQPELRSGRRMAHYFYRDPRRSTDDADRGDIGTMIELKLVTRIRERLAEWRRGGYPGASRVTMDLFDHWNRDGRQQRLFFAQREAVETIVFLKEARSDFLQGIDVQRDDPSPERQAEGFAGFQRYACKMATGSGKTTVMGMLAAWSILNKVANRGDARYSDVVLIVCPNVTIRDRLRELNTESGEASLYRTRDLVPPHLMQQLSQGRVLVTNWHVFEKQTVQVGGISARVSKAGVPVEDRTRLHIGEQNTTARGKRYVTLETLQLRLAAGEYEAIAGSEQHDRQGNLVSLQVRDTRYVESDTALVNRILGREIGGKRNILVMNDEAHHAYRIRKTESDEGDLDLFEDDDEAEEFFKEATVWIDGLDRIQKQRGINFCIDLSATPYYLGRVGQATNRPFPWVVSDFGLIDAIESGLVKIPQLAVRDSTGKDIPGYFNIWHWILPQLSPAERGGKRANPRPEAILRYAHTPIAMLGGLWEERRREFEQAGDPRTPVFILVCKNTQIAKTIYEWLAENKPPEGIPFSKLDGFRNAAGQINTIRVDSKVVHETDTDGAKSDESRWMRFTLDTVGKQAWPMDQQDRAIYPEGFEALAEKLQRPLHPPGKEVRCIVSVGMLTEGWDCNTVTHIVGLRPFMSQLLCEQVVGRGLRRTSYETDDRGMFVEETATVFGVPFEIIPFKANPQSGPKPTPPRHHVMAQAHRAQYEIKFPRVIGYTQAIRNKIAVDWQSVPPIALMPDRIPTEVTTKGLHVADKGRLSLSGPGDIHQIDLTAFRRERRLQELEFDFAWALTRMISSTASCDIPVHALFPQLQTIVKRYIAEKVSVNGSSDVKDLFLAPYHGWLIEALFNAIRPDTSQGETPEVPRYETMRGPGSTSDVDFWTSKDVREVVRSHVNFMVADTKRWEQSAAYAIDTHPQVKAFVKNAGLGFAIPYVHDGQSHDYVPDFIVKMYGESEEHLILETKGYDERADVKKAAANRWVAAVNSDGLYGRWRYVMIRRVEDVSKVLGREGIESI